MKTVCNRCGTVVVKETDKELMKEYPYYCPKCDENMYSFEIHHQSESPDEWERSVISYLLMHDYLPLNATWIIENEEVRLAIAQLLHKGIVRMRHCEGKAIELSA